MPPCMSCFRIRLSVSLTSFSIWEMTGPVRTTLSLLMSPAKLTPASDIKGFHRDMSNALHAAAVCIGRFESRTPQTWECGSASAVWRLKWGAGMWKRMWLWKEGMWQKERWENKRGERKGEKERRRTRRNRYTHCVNVIGCFVFQSHPQIQMWCFYLSSPIGRMWENDGFEGWKRDNGPKDMEANMDVKI